MQLKALGAQIRARRKALGVSATVTAEAAALSRVTLHRIEKGTPSVAMGAWANVCAALGMALAWQVQGTDWLAPLEAHGIYERNARHLDSAALDERERTLMEALRTAFGASGV